MGRGKTQFAVAFVALVLSAAGPVLSASLREVGIFRRPLGTCGYFGDDVALEGGLALVGACGESAGADNAAAFVFDARTGDLLTTLRVPNTLDGRSTGISVDLSGEHAIVGEWLDGEEKRGRVHVFNARTGDHVRTLADESLGALEGLRIAVAIEGNVALVSAVPPGGDANRLNEVRRFDFATGAERAPLVQSPDHVFGPRVGSIVGGAVAISESVAVVATEDRPASLFDLRTGQLLAEFDNDERTDRDVFLNRDAAIDGSVALLAFEFSRNRSLQTVSAVTGERLATLSSGKSDQFLDFGSVVALDGRYALIAADRSPFGGTELWLFDAYTGDQLSTLAIDEFSPPGQPLGPIRSLAMDDGLAVVGGFHGTRVFQIVPEPHAAGLLLMAVGACAARRHSRGDARGAPGADA